MKAFFSIIAILVFAWAVYVGVEYFRVYKDANNDLLITINIEKTDEYTKKTGLGFSIIEYNIEDMKDGDRLKEFKIFKWQVSETICVA